MQYGTVHPYPVNKEESEALNVKRLQTFKYVLDLLMLLAAGAAFVFRLSTVATDSASLLYLAVLGFLLGAWVSLLIFAQREAERLHLFLIAATIGTGIFCAWLIYFLDSVLRAGLAMVCVALFTLDTRVGSAITHFAQKPGSTQAGGKA
jgi:hypothetical protein